MSKKLVRIYNKCVIVAAVIGLFVRILFSPKVLVIVLFIFMLLWTGGVGKQIRYVWWRLGGVPAKEARIIADAEIDKDTYFESVEKIRKRIRRDPEWAVKSLLYSAALREDEFTGRNPNKIERWPDINVMYLRIYKEAFMKENYVWWEEDTLMVKKIVDDEEMQELFEKAMILAETGRIDSGYAFALYTYNEEHKDEVQKEMRQKTY